MTTRTLVRGGVVVSAAGAAPADVLVEGERIAAVGLDLAGRCEAERTIDAGGRLVVPGGVDVHTHMELEASGTVASDDFATGTAAAAWGGTTTIVDYAGHERGEPLAEGLARWHRKADGRACVDYGFHMMLSEVSEQVLADMAGLVADGVSSFKVFTAYPDRYMIDDGQVLQVLQRAAELPALVAVHAENGPAIEVLRAELLAGGHRAPIDHARSRPPALEGEATARVIVLAELAGAPLHVAHLSAAPALAAVRAARERGAAVHAETCPQYLYLSEEDLDRPGIEGARFVCSPPLRPAPTQAALWQGLRLGDLEVVATDHCPFTSEQKAAGLGDFTRIPNGLHGVEDRLTLLYEGVHRQELTVERWVEVCATAPAKLFGLYPRKGAIVPGADADLVVFDPAVERVMSAGTHHMNVDYSCYEGLVVHGRPEVVLQRGRILVDAEGFHGRPGDGRYLPRGAPAA